MIKTIDYLCLDFSKPSFGFRSKDGSYLIPADFDPWTGAWIEDSFYNDFFTVIEKRPNLEASRKNMDPKMKQEFTKRQEKHSGTSVCDDMNYMVSGYEQDKTSLAYIPTIRAYVFFKKNERGVFEAMDFCPFCGAKLPERLDEKLTEILRKEYELDSWKDYKKAPHEFHTDEWWKKRGL